MGCLENWAFGVIPIVAGNLPDPTSAVAAGGVAFAIYGFLFMGYGALGRAVCVRSEFDLIFFLFNFILVWFG